MSGDEQGAEAGEVKAANREYQHQRECILQYLIDCGVVTEDKGAGGKLAKQDHMGFEFDTSTIGSATREFLTVSDARMRDGSNAERIALAKLIEQYRLILPISPPTTMFAEVVRTANSRRGQNGADANRAAARAEAEKVRDITDAATRKPDGTLAKPGGVGLLMGPRFGKTRLSPKTVKKYDDLNRGVGKVDDRPTEDRE